MASSIVYEKAFEFAIDIIKLYKDLCENKKEYILSKQLLRCGTSIGANIKEGLDGQSKRDFVAKLGIALKETSETKYWLELLMAVEYIENDNGKLLVRKVDEIHRLLNSIILTSKEKILESKNSPLSTLNSQLY